MPGTLYVVATPIGNLEDITQRALRILREVDLIAAEDTRVTRKLLSHFDIHTSLTSYHQHTRGEKADTLVDRLETGSNIAVVSDAGMPGISDPGTELIRMAIDRGIAVVPIPGPNAALCGLVVSGLPTGRFAFDGFPPRTKTDRREFFGRLRAEDRTILLYEAPSRLLATLRELREVVGDREVGIAREITKLHEEVFRGTLSAAIEHFERKVPRGEFTLVIAPAPPAAPAEPADAGDVRAALRRAIEGGATPRDAARIVAEALDLPRRAVYGELLAMRSDEADEE